MKILLFLRESDGFGLETKEPWTLLLSNLCDDGRQSQGLLGISATIRTKTNSWNQLHSISQQRSKQKGGWVARKNLCGDGSTCTLQNQGLIINWPILRSDRINQSRRPYLIVGTRTLQQGWEPKRICTRRKSLLQSSGGSWLARQRAAGQEMNFRRRRWRRISSSFSSMLLFFIREMVEIC